VLIARVIKPIAHASKLPELASAAEFRTINKAGKLIMSLCPPFSHETPYLN